MARIALVGASGRAGSRILKELSDRGHTITAIARNPEKIASLPQVTAKKGDVSDKSGLAALLKGHDATVSAVHFASSDARILIEAVRAAGVKRYLVVGGAGSLEVSPGKRLVDQPDFPAAYKTEALKGAEFLDLLKGEKELDWTFLSRPHCSSKASAPANSAWARMRCSPAIKAVGSRSKTTPSRLSTRSKSRRIRVSDLPSDIDVGSCKRPTVASAPRRARAVRPQSFGQRLGKAQAANAGAGVPPPPLSQSRAARCAAAISPSDI